MRRSQPSPLGRRHGLEAACLRTPADGAWTTQREYLVERLAPYVDASRIDDMLRDGEFVDQTGPINQTTRFTPETRVWFHRDLPDETPVPFAMDIVYRDDRIVVADKPHFLATIPRGRHILETALMRLRRDLDLPDLIPAHRLDRATAGLILFVADPALRGKYQTMFQKHKVTKIYEAIAPHRPDLPLPCVVTSRILKDRNVLQAYEVDGEPNAETLVELVESRDGLGRYRLSPKTGRTHQLRLHMNGLGVPIVGDDMYPEVLDRPLDDFTNPLQLLAAQLEFTDPVTGEPRSFRSRRTLVAFPPR